MCQITKGKVSANLHVSYHGFEMKIRLHSAVSEAYSSIQGLHKFLFVNIRIFELLSF